MKLKDYIKQVLETSEAKEVEFDLLIKPDGEGNIIVVQAIDAPVASRIRFTVRVSDLIGEVEK